MKYKIGFKPRALKDCRKISKPQLAHIFKQIENRIRHRKDAYK